jgi:hypothetical protein
VGDRGAVAEHEGRARRRGCCVRGSDGTPPARWGRGCGSGSSGARCRCAAHLVAVGADTANTAFEKPLSSHWPGSARRGLHGVVGGDSAGGLNRSSETCQGR